MPSPRNYGGNDDAAKAFTERTGIQAYKFDVSDYAACEAGVKQIEQELGPVEVLVNNAGITRDTDAAPDDAGAMAGSDRHQSRLLLQHVPLRDRRHAQPQFRPDRQHRLDQTARPGSTVRSTMPRRSRASTASPRPWPRKGAGKGITVNAIAPGYVDTDMVRAVPADGAGEDHRPDPDEAPGPGRRHRPRRCLPGRRRRRLHHRLHPVDQRRPAHVLRRRVRGARSATRAGKARPPPSRRSPWRKARASTAGARSAASARCSLEVPDRPRRAVRDDRGRVGVTPGESQGPDGRGAFCGGRRAVPRGPGSALAGRPG